MEVDAAETTTTAVDMEVDIATALGAVAACTSVPEVLVAASLLAVSPAVAPMAAAASVTDFLATDDEGDDLPDFDGEDTAQPEEQATSSTPVSANLEEAATPVAKAATTPEVAPAPLGAPNACTDVR